MDDLNKPCPYCAEPIRAEAIKCRYCGSRVDRGAFARSWFRRREGKLLGGVCAGLAAEFAISVTLIRVGFLVATVLGFWAVPLYLALWVIMPLAPRQPAAVAAVDPDEVELPRRDVDRYEPRP